MACDSVLLRNGLRAVLGHEHGTLTCTPQPCVALRGRGRRQMGRGDRAQVSTADDGLREYVCGVYTSVEPAAVRGRGHPPDEEGEGPLMAGERRGVPAGLSPAPETQSECVLGLGRVRVEVVLVEDDDELFRLKPKAIVQELSGRAS